MSAFLKARSGNVAVTAAITIFPLTLMAGGLLDWQRGSNFKGDLQAAVDSATITLARAYIEDPTADLSAQAATAVEANTQNRSGEITGVTATVTGSRIRVTATGAVDTSFLSLMSIDTIAVSASSATTWGNEAVEIALVLDNTASMLDAGKFDAMKSAAVELVNSVTRQIPLSSKRKFALVPFSNFVNVGSGHRTSTWIDGQALSPNHSAYFQTAQNRFSLYDHLGVAWPGCVETRPAPYDIDDTPPTTATPATLFVPAFHPDEPDNGFMIGPYLYPYANSYLTDSATGDAIERTRHVTKYSTKAGYNNDPSPLYSNYSKPKGPQMFCDVAPIMPLTTSKSATTTAIGGMVAVGSTNIPEGLAWGWRVLSPTAPFTEGAAYSSATRKFAILLTDGTNAVSTFPLSALGGAYSSWGYPYSQRLGANPGTNLRDGLDAKLRTLCTQMKATGIQIYTIGLMIDDVPGQQLLAECASGPDYYFNSPSAAQLSIIFDRIVEGILMLRFEE